jgi:hypothetical protein
MGNNIALLEVLPPEGDGFLDLGHLPFKEQSKRFFEQG